MFDRHVVKMISSRTVHCLATSRNIHIRNNVSGKWQSHVFENFGRDWIFSKVRINKINSKELFALVNSMVRHFQKLEKFSQYKHERPNWIFLFLYVLRTYISSLTATLMPLFHIWGKVWTSRFESHFWPNHVFVENVLFFP